MTPKIMFSGSTAAMALAGNEQVTARNKHIDIKTYHIKELIRNNVIHLSYVSSAANIADILTKPVSYRVLNGIVC